MQKKVNRADKILILILLVASLVAIYFSINRARQKSQVYVSIQVDGVEIDRLDLSKSMDGQDKVYKTKYGTNVVSFKDGQVYVSHADCRDKICMMEKPISKKNEMIICLPHHFVVEIKGFDGGDGPDVMVK